MTDSQSIILSVSIHFHERIWTDLLYWSSNFNQLNLIMAREFLALSEFYAFCWFKYFASLLMFDRLNVFFLNYFVVLSAISLRNSIVLVIYSPPKWTYERFKLLFFHSHHYHILEICTKYEHKAQKYIIITPDQINFARLF